MTDQDIYFKGSEGMRRLSDYSEDIACFNEGIKRCEYFCDKRGKHMEKADYLEMTGALLKFNEYYWKQFHKFVDKACAYKKYMA